MPITNIRDHRKRPFRFKKVNVVVEATVHDNNCKDADKVKGNMDVEPAYEEREHVSIQEAVHWADSFPSEVTLYVYDEDSGIYPTERLPKS